MKVLVACEESQAVCKAFRARGHEAFSCDIQECSGGQPEWHIQSDVIPLFRDGWDLVIAHPPCTYLTVAGNRWFKENPGRAALRELAYEFAMKFVKAYERGAIRKLCIENPVGYLNTHYRKPDQIIYPYYFGDSYSKRTCLWLFNLPKLVPDNVVECESKCQGGWFEHPPKGVPRSVWRSKTAPGIARAMAEQWGCC